MRKIIFILIVTINYLSAFTFDKLESGYTFQKIIYLAQDNNWGLCVDDYMLIPNKFQWSSLRHKEKYRIFHYYDIIFNERARIDLYFTKKSNELYKVKITWRPNKELEDIIINILNKKYNEGNRVFPASFSKNILSNFKEWKPDSNTLIKMKTGIVGIEVTYIDLEYEFNEYKEKTRKKMNMIVTDSKKL